MAYNGKKLVIGMDGGGTKTLGVLMTEDGVILAEGAFPSTNPHSNPEAAVRTAIHSIILDLSRDAGLPATAIDGVGMGMAGVDRPADRAFMEGIVREVLPAAKLLIVNDAVVAIVAVLKELHGILVIGGTGSICLGYHRSSPTPVRCGGWGHILADEGSGYAIGVGALKAILHAHDGRGPATTLTARVLAELGLEQTTDLIGWTYMKGNGKTEVAALSRLVHEEAEKGDAAALAILRHEAQALFSIIPPVYEKLFAASGECARLALWGGNLINAKLYQSLFLDLVAKSGMNVEVVVKDERAVVGAAQHMLNHL